MSIYRFLLLFILLTGQKNVLAQNQQPKTSATVHEYYLYISGVTTRNQVTELETLVAGKPGVIYFMANRFPVRYFLLRSTVPIDEQQFKAWLPPSTAQVTAFGLGSIGKEKALLQFKKNKTTTP